MSESTNPESQSAGGDGKSAAEREPKIVVRDRRRIDPATGEARSDAPPPPVAGRQGAETGAANNPELSSLRTQLAERTNDLQRITAEYANYRKRVERERVTVVEHATAIVLTNLLPVLDDIERARAHGDLEGAFGAVADQLLATLAKSGLQPFGEVGDGFDPARHEAVSHNVSDEVRQATCTQVLRQGYVLGERLLRTALVAVTEPATAPAPPVQAPPAQTAPVQENSAETAKADTEPAETDSKPDTETS